MNSQANIPVKRQQFLLILILGLLTSIGPLSIDMYLPAFPDIAQSMNTDPGRVALSLSSFFVGLSVGQLIYGPLLERYGRKLPLYSGIVVYLAASGACALAMTMNQLIILRFFQAIGACAGMVTSRAIVRDFFDTKRVAQVFSTLMMVVAVSPIIAPTLGGFLTASLGWRYIFLILAILSLCILVMSLFLLPATKPGNPAYSLKPRPVLKGFREVFKNPQFLIYAFAGAVSYASVYAYLSGSPHMYIEIFKVSEQQYGLIFAVIAIGLIGASQVNSLVLKRRPGEKLMYLALLAQCFFAIILLISMISGFTGVILTTAEIFFYVVCLGFVFPNASALSMSTLGHTAGNASALLGAVQMTIGAVASALVSLFQGESSLSMAVVMAGCAFLSLILLHTGRKHIL